MGSDAPNTTGLPSPGLGPRGFEEPLLEFSGACEGCGETPYAKLVTQMRRGRKRRWPMGLMGYGPPVIFRLGGNQWSEEHVLLLFFPLFFFCLPHDVSSWTTFLVVRRSNKQMAKAVALGCFRIYQGNPSIFNRKDTDAVEQHESFYITSFPEFTDFSHLFGWDHFCGKQKVSGVLAASLRK